MSKPATTIALLLMLMIVLTARFDFVQKVVAESKKRTYIIAIDAMRADYLGSYHEHKGAFDGHSGLLTPNMTFLASQGTNYTNAVGVLTALTATNHVAIVTAATAGTSGILGAGGYYAGLNPSSHTAILRRYNHDHVRVVTLFNKIPNLKTAMVSGKNWVGDVFNDTDVDIVVYPGSNKNPSYIAPTSGYILSGAPHVLKGDSATPVRYYIPKSGETPPSGYNSSLSGVVDSDDMPSDEWVINQAIEVVKQDDPDFMYILLGNVDEAGHFYGSFMDTSVSDLNTLKNPDAMRDQLYITDQQVKNFVKHLKDNDKFSNSIIAITADHGMSTMKNPTKSVDVRKILKDNGIDMRANDTDLHPYNASGRYDWCCSEGPVDYIFNVASAYTQTIKNILLNYAFPGTVSEKPVWRVLNQSEQQTGTNDQTGRPYKLYYGGYADVQWPDLIVLFKPNYMGTIYKDEVEGGLNNFMMSVSLPPGTNVPLIPGAHGTYSEQPVPLILVGPCVPKGISVSTQVSNIDIVPTICELNGWFRPPFGEGELLASDIDVGIGSACYDENNKKVVLSSIKYKSGSMEPVNVTVSAVQVGEVGMVWDGQRFRIFHTIIIVGSKKMQLYKSQTYSVEFPYVPKNSVGTISASIRPKGFKDCKPLDNDLQINYVLGGVQAQPRLIRIPISNPSKSSPTPVFMDMNSSGLPPGWNWYLDPPPGAVFVLPPGETVNATLVIIPSPSAEEGDIGQATVSVILFQTGDTYIAPHYFIAIDTIPPSVAMVHAEGNMRVIANVTDFTTPVADVLLRYKVGAAWEMADMNLVRNDTYEACIGPFFDGQEIEYNITTTDMVENEATYGPFYYKVSETWPMFHHDLQHTGLSPVEAPETNLTLWNYHTDGGVSSSPAVTDNAVFVGSADNKIYAVEASTGKQLWNATVAGAIISSPAVADGRVFIGSSAGFICAYNETTGALIWSRTTLGGVTSSPMINKGKVFVGSGYGAGKFYALNETNGELIWIFGVEEGFHSSPAVVDGMIFVGSYDNKVYALPEDDPNRDGIITLSEVVWSYTTNGDIESSPVVAHSRVYVGSCDGKLYVLRKANGQLVWSYTTAGPVRSSPAVAEGKVLVGSDDGGLYCFDALASKATKLWEFQTSSPVSSSPAVASGKVFFGAHNSKIYALNATDGQQIWSYRTEGVVASSPAIAYGRVFAGSDDGKIYAFGQQVDIAVTEITSEKTVVGQGYAANIDVDVANQGQLRILDSVCLQCLSGPTIGVQMVIVDGGAGKTILFIWNTTGVPKGNYTFASYASLVSGETDTTDNFCVGSWIVVTIPGDVDGDFNVDIYDVVAVCVAYGSKRGDLEYKPNCDINNDAKIDIYDVVIACAHYGEKCP